MEPRPAAARTAASAAASRARIAEEHRVLSDLLGKLVACRELSALPGFLERLRDLLAVHFTHEEGPGGLHTVVGESATHTLPAVQRLIEEHRVVLVRLQDLLAETERLLHGPVAEIHARIHDLAALLARHEAEEDALFADSFFVDLGGG
jgi:hypothetical protein